MSAIDENNMYVPSSITKELTDQYYKDLLRINNINFNDLDFPWAHEYLCDKVNLINDDNRNISSKVLERLLLRHSILRNLEELENSYAVSRTFVPKNRRIFVGGSPAKTIRDRLTNIEVADVAEPVDQGAPPGGSPASQSPKNLVNEFEFDKESERNLRVYRLATTDLFVEKAIAYLEEDSASYVKRGIMLFSVTLLFIFLGFAFSGYVFLWKPDVLDTEGSHKLFSILEDYIQAQRAWSDLARSFVKGFTFYGFIVLLAVFCARLGKAMMDQAERLRERRHSLRQGRLYIHLSNGEVTIEEIEKAFDWNVSKGNAFGSIQTEASAPWGGVIKEALKAIPEIFKKSKGAMKD